MKWKSSCGTGTSAWPQRQLVIAHDSSTCSPAERFWSGPERGQRHDGGRLDRHSGAVASRSREQEQDVSRPTVNDTGSRGLAMYRCGRRASEQPHRDTPPRPAVGTKTGLASSERGAGPYDERPSRHGCDKCPNERDVHRARLRRWLPSPIITGSSSLIYSPHGSDERHAEQGHHTRVNPHVEP